MDNDPVRESWYDNEIFLVYDRTDSKTYIAVEKVICLSEFVWRLYTYCA